MMMQHIYTKNVDSLDTHTIYTYAEVTHTRTTRMHAYTLTNLIYKQEEHNIMVSMSILYS